LNKLLLNGTQEDLNRLLLSATPQELNRLLLTPQELSCRQHVLVFQLLFWWQSFRKKLGFAFLRLQW